MKSNLAVAITDAEVDGLAGHGTRILFPPFVNRRSAWICEEPILLFPEQFQFAD